MLTICLDTNWYMRYVFWFSNEGEKPFCDVTNILMNIFRYVIAWFCIGILWQQANINIGTQTHGIGNNTYAHIHTYTHFVQWRNRLNKTFKVFKIRGDDDQAHIFKSGNFLKFPHCYRIESKFSHRQMDLHRIGLFWQTCDSLYFFPSCYYFFVSVVLLFVSVIWCLKEKCGSDFYRLYSSFSFFFFYSVVAAATFVVVVGCFSWLCVHVLHILAHSEWECLHIRWDAKGKSRNWNVTAIILDFPLQPYYVRR